MKYFTVRPNTEFWHDYIKFRAKWRERYNLSTLARELGFSVSYLSEVLKGANKGEISTRLIATMMKITGSHFNEVWRTVEFKKEPNDFQSDKVRAQFFSSVDDDKNEYLLTQDQQYNALIASMDFASRTKDKIRSWRKKIFFWS